MGNKQGILASKKSKDKIFLLQTCEEHEGSINCMDVSEDGSVLATGSDDKTIRLWSAKTEIVECIGRLEGHEDYITSVTILDNYLISTSADKTIRKWLLSACECLIVFEGHDSTVNKITYSSDYLFSISYDKKVKCWNFESGECIKTFTGHKNNINSILFISGERDASGNVISHKITDKRKLVNQKNKLPLLKSMNNRNKEGNDEENKDNECHDIIITGSLDSLAKSWSVETGKCIHTFSGHTGPITCIASDLKKEILFTGSSDHSIRSWDIASGQLLRTFSGHHTTVLSLATNKKLLFSTSADHTAKSWALEFGDCTRTYKEHTHSVSTLIENDGLIYTGCGDSLVRCFDIKSGTLKRSFKGHTGAINCLKIMQRRLFTGSFDGTVKIWDISDLEPERSGLNPSQSNNNSSVNVNKKSQLGSGNYKHPGFEISTPHRFTIENEKSFQARSAINKASLSNHNIFGSEADSGFDDRDFTVDKYSRKQKMKKFDKDFV